MLDQLVQCEGTAILYTHLGKVEDEGRPLGPRATLALRELAQRRERGDVLVTTTQRLLRYLITRDALRCHVAVGGARTVVVLESIDDPVTGPRIPSLPDLEGLTLGVEGAETVELRFPDGTTIPAESVRGAEGGAWASVPWPPLRFPALSRG
jgi:hypothetical protein